MLISLGKLNNTLRLSNVQKILIILDQTFPKRLFLAYIQQILYTQIRFGN